MLTGKPALVTGSVSGIGFATARTLAAQGCNVMLNGFAPAEVIAPRVGELQKLGVRAAHHPADLRHPDQIAELVKATEREFGGPDILVNNAVVRYSGAVENFAPEHWDEELAVNLSAPFHTNSAVPGRHEGAELGPHRQYGLHLRPVRDRQPHRLHYD
jgi:3-hydroxybutyrate dehydrogenase